jgi:hypothetical protein
MNAETWSQAYRYPLDKRIRAAVATPSGAHPVPHTGDRIQFPGFV